MKLKRTKKYLYRDNDVEGRQGKIKLRWGYLTFYIFKQKNGKYNYELVWTNTDTGSDTTLARVKNQDLDDYHEVVYEILGIAQDYFEDHPMRCRIESTIGQLEEVRATF